MISGLPRPCRKVNKIRKIQNGDWPSSGDTGPLHCRPIKNLVPTQTLRLKHGFQTWFFFIINAGFGIVLDIADIFVKIC